LRLAVQRQERVRHGGLHGTVGAGLGAWSSAFTFVEPVDFDAFTTTGTYTVSVGSATSPPFKIDSGQNVYATPLANGLLFYQSERDGPNFIPNALRTAPGHVNDTNAMTYVTPNANSSGHFSGDLTPLGTRIDASGGWWDAGDYIKGVETLGYATALLLHGVRDFPTQMSSYSAEAKFGTDWLLRMWDDSTKTFYYQVGIGEGNAKTVGDHELWRLPQDDDTYGGTDRLTRYIRNRPVFARARPARRSAPTSRARRRRRSRSASSSSRGATVPSPIAACSRGSTSSTLANTSPRQLTTYIPFSFYPETEWYSDLELGAAELYFAAASGRLPAGAPHTDPLFYLGKPPTGPVRTCPAPTTPPTRSTSTTSAASRTTSSTRRSGRRGTPPGWRRRRRRSSPT
jgi:endoglucanase